MKGDNDYGSAMLMRGKSVTCRTRIPTIQVVYGRTGSETLVLESGRVSASRRLAAHQHGRAMTKRLSAPMMTPTSPDRERGPYNSGHAF